MAKLILYAGVAAERRLLTKESNQAPSGPRPFFKRPLSSVACGDTSGRALRCSLKEALIKPLSDFILEFLFNARNKSTRIASYLRRLMTKHWIKMHMKFDSAN